MLALLNNEQENEEVHYACIRYLGKYPLEEAYPVLLDLVKYSRQRRADAIVDGKDLNKIEIPAELICVVSGQPFISESFNCLSI